jgi:hypothetical protein
MMKLPTSSEIPTQEEEAIEEDSGTSTNDMMTSFMSSDDDLPSEEMNVSNR